MSLTLNMFFFFQILNPGNLDALEPLTVSRLVELSIIAPSGTEGIGEDMRLFAEQLKPYPLKVNTLAKIGHFSKILKQL